MTTYLVTGGAGFIGSHLATALVERGDTVRVLDNLDTGKETNLAHLGNKITFIQGDIRNSNHLEYAIGDAEVIFHHAAIASVPRSVADPIVSNDVGVNGTMQVLEAARRTDVRRVVLASSSAIYGEPLVNATPRPNIETDLPAPMTPYAISKLTGEHYLKSYFRHYGIETVSLRYFNVFGPGQDPEGAYAAVIPKFVMAMLAGNRPKIFGDGTQSRDFIHISDVVQGNLLAAEVSAAAGEVFNLACGKKTTLLDLVKNLNDLLKTSLEPQFFSERPGDIHTSLADITRATEILGFHPKMNLATGLASSIDYYHSLAEGPL